MTKEILIREIANKTGMTQGNVITVLEGYADVVIETLTKDSNDKVVLPNLGTFKVRDVAERSGKSVLTGEPWTKPAHKKLHFDLSSAAKEAIV